MVDDRPRSEAMTDDLYGGISLPYTSRRPHSGLYGARRYTIARAQQRASSRSRGRRESSRRRSGMLSF
jgi:hypothetical protein